MSGDIADRLREHPFSRDFCPEHIALMAAMASQVCFPAGEIIFQEGGQSSLFYLLVTGKVALEAGSPGRSLRVTTLIPGDVLGWSSVTGDAVHQLQARALGCVHALSFDGPRLRQACEADYSFGFRFARAVVEVMTGRLRAIRAQLRDVDNPMGDEK
jgi:CRP-like cAMP-binding protein